MRRAMLDGSIRYDIGGQIGAAYASRAAMAPRFTTPAPAYAAAGPDFSALSAAADKILAAAQVVQSIPDRIEVPVRVGSRDVALASREGAARIGAPAQWGAGPQSQILGGRR